MVRNKVLSVAWAALLSACALDLSGLGTGPGLDDGAAGSSAGEASTDDQSVASPLTLDSSDELAEESEAGQVEAASADGMGSTDSAAASDAHTDAGSLCDEDGDGYLAATSACGGNDCCDQDAHVHPGQTSYFTEPGTCGGFDYNCDGKETEEYGAASCTWSTFSCSGNGFAAPVPGCGDVGSFTSCSIPWYNVFSCTGSDAQQAQGCR